MLHRGPKTDAEKLGRAVLAQAVARHLRGVVAGYREPHPRLRQRAIGAIAAALDCSAMTVERLEREGVLESRDFSDVDVDWPPELATILEVDRGLRVLGEPLPPEVGALFFGDSDGAPAEPGRKGSPFANWDELVAAWDRWRVETQPPHESWWACWRVDHSLSAKAANARAEAVRATRVTEATGESWAEQTKGGEWLVFFEREDGETP